MKTRIKMGLSCLLLTILAGVSQQGKAIDPPTDPAHATHVAASTPSGSGQALDAQLAELKAKVQQLERIIQQHPGTSAAAHGSSSAMGKIPPKGPMAGMVNSGAGVMPSMSGKPMRGGMAGMGMMDMDKMEGGRSMGSGGRGMMDMMMGGKSDGGMKGMEGMMGMMGNMGGSGMAMSSALPGFPGASHLYHIGATDFFLDHPQHITLTMEQQAALNQAKEQALLAKGAADRAIQQAEQELWTLTAADQPDASKIQAKIAEIGKLTGDARFAFISAVGDASKILTDEQRKILTGFAPPAPAAAPMTGEMKDM